LVLLSLAASSFAQNPRCNMMPAQMTTQMSQLIFDNNECIGVKDFGTFYVDYDKQLSRADLSIMSTGGNVKISAWIDYNTQIEYILDRESGDCQSMMYPYPLGSNMIPSNAEYTGTIAVGSQMIDTYWIPSFPGFEGISAELGVTAKFCYPATASIFNNTFGDNNLWVSESLWNTVDSTPPYIFEVPDTCTGDKVKRVTPTTHMLTRFHPKFYRMGKTN